MLQIISAAWKLFFFTKQREKYRENEDCAKVDVKSQVNFERYVGDLTS